MPKYIKYRGAGKVPITKEKLAPGQKGKPDPIMEVWPRKDWVNPGEHVPVRRHKSNIHSQTSAIPKRKERKEKS